MGFRKTIVFDVSGDDGTEMWKDISDLADIIIPYIPSGTKEDADRLYVIGFTDVLVSGIRFFQDISKRYEIRSCMLL
jgi:hypothetical protein